MSTLMEIGDYIDSQVAGLTQGQNIFLGRRQDAPDVTVTIYQYPGGEPEAVQELEVNIERVQIQVVVRGSSKDYDSADNLCARVWNTLAGVRNATLSGTRYRSIVPTGRGTMGTDTNDRPLVGFNATVEKEVSLVA